MESEMKNPVVKGFVTGGTNWIAATVMAVVLVTPGVAAAGQDFALDEQVRQRDQTERAREQAEFERERAERQRERARISRANASRTCTSRDRTPSSARSGHRPSNGSRHWSRPRLRAQTRPSIGVRTHLTS